MIPDLEPEEIDVSWGAGRAKRTRRLLVWQLANKLVWAGQDQDLMHPTVGSVELHDVELLPGRDRSRPSVARLGPKIFHVKCREFPEGVRLHQNHVDPRSERELLAAKNGKVKAIRIHRWVYDALSPKGCSTPDSK